MIVDAGSADERKILSFFLRQLAPTLDALFSVPDHVIVPSFGLVQVGLWVLLLKAAVTRCACHLSSLFLAGAAVTRCLRLSLRSAKVTLSLWLLVRRQLSEELVLLMK